ncbi:MAG: exodeoxyribonuclease VII small subunit [Bacteroidales bacterium]|nr:exodeoxyribonuclease VII small subunit [Bacteroidales bacterium]
MTKKMLYAEAYEELQLLVSELENGEITVDELADKVKRAAQLIRFCKEKLHSTELEVNMVLKELGDTPKTASEGLPEDRGGLSSDFET